MAVERKLMTAEELWAMPNDGMRHELVEGELRTMPPTGWEHGRYEVGISHRLRAAGWTTTRSASWVAATCSRASGCGWPIC